jgi:hypothetical protein
MNAYTHTIIAIASMLVAYFTGMYWSRKDLIDKVVEAFLIKLENDGFIKTVIDKDGDKELVPVSTVVAEALKEKSNGC